MAALFAVCLITLKVVNGGADLVALLLAGTDRIDRVTHHLQRLKGHHDLVILDVVTGQKQNLC